MDVLGGPVWLDKERYDITAVTSENVSAEQMMGPMMRQLLEERLQIQAHPEQKPTPVFRMTVASGGLKIRQSESECVPLKVGEAPKSGEGGARSCGYGSTSARDGVMVMERHGMTVQEFATFLAPFAGRPISDDTGLSPRFDFHLEFARERNGAPLSDDAASDPAGSSLFTALREQLGLVLTADKVPMEVIVVDRAEKPSEN